jgi:cell wall-associated NlpC family hydrolase
MSRAFLLCLLALVLAGAAVVIVGLAGGGAEAAEPARVTAPRPPAPAAAKAPVPLGSRAARIAVRAVGTPYRYGGASLGGFDCSGLVMWTYAKLGVRLPHNAWSQSQVGTPVTRRTLRPGDLLFFRGYGHVGLYVGRGRMVHAPQSGERVEVVRLATRDDLAEVRRISA